MKKHLNILSFSIIIFCLFVSVLGYNRAITQAHAAVEECLECQNETEPTPEPTFSLSVGSCLYSESESATTLFKMTLKNKGDAAQWRLRKAGSGTIIGPFTLAAGEKREVDTSEEGTWVKQVNNNGSWQNRGGTHVTSVAGHTKNEFYCPAEESPEPTPTPTPNPTPTPSPDTTDEDKEKGKQSRLGYDTSCSTATVYFTMDLKEDGNARESIMVKFRYNGSESSSKTNAGGRATTTFDRAATAVAVFADPEDGYPGQSVVVEIPENCGAVLGAATDTGISGQVLGASTDPTTFADTGSGMPLPQLVVSAGVALSIAGVYLIRRK